MSENPVSRLTALLAGLLLLLSLGWWWLVFGSITTAGTISPLEAAVCLAADTDLCRLAEALCTSGHFIDIRWYAPEIFWAALAVSLVAAVKARRSPSL